ncbi:MAG: DUF2225 domain-containing protein [Bacillota bacterium]
MSQVPHFCRLRCPECFTSFPAEIIRSTGSGGFLESDLCYRAGNIFVYPFLVVVCPGCRFAAWASEFDYLAEFPQYSEYHPIRRALGEFLREQRRLYPGSERYRLAAETAMRKGASELKLAHLYLRGAWCAREEKNREAESYHQEEAVRHFRKALSEGLYGMDAAVACYLVGELCRRLGRFTEALAVFAGVKESALPDWLRPGFAAMRERARLKDDTPQVLPRNLSE